MDSHLYPGTVLGLVPTHYLQYFNNLLSLSSPNLYQKTLAHSGKDKSRYLKSDFRHICLGSILF